MGLDARLAMGQENFNNLRNQVNFSTVVVVVVVVFSICFLFLSLICIAQGFGMPRQSPLEEGEHAGDTDDDVMMIDEVDNKGRSSGRRDIGRGRRSRSRSDSRGKKGKRRRTKSRSRSRDRLDNPLISAQGENITRFSGTGGGGREAGAGSRA